jgi:hypothetical protein
MLHEGNPAWGDGVSGVSIVDSAMSRHMGRYRSGCLLVGR